jgi:hypothetical protein
VVSRKVVSGREYRDNSIEPRRSPLASGGARHHPGHMPRPLRIHAPQGFYHVTLRGNHRQAIFTQDCERTLLNIIVARAMNKFEARLHAYCWMTNHLHLIVQVSDEPLGKVDPDRATWIARSALDRGETLAAVARALQRDEASIRAALRNREGGSRALLGGPQLRLSADPE